jgi:hypothetical protein
MPSTIAPRPFTNSATGELQARGRGWAIAKRPERGRQAFATFLERHGRDRRPRSGAWAIGWASDTGLRRGVKAGPQVPLRDPGVTPRSNVAPHRQRIHKR